ncbi:MAG: CRP-like cAMP-binding protein [Planctomycetota bacterium]|jgi:CRP-like cAMP-binding protein
MKTINVTKGQILQRKGDLNTNVYTVVSGMLRSYSIDEKGKEHIYLFAPENWIIADAIPVGKPSELFIDVIEDATLIVNDKTIDLNSLEGNRTVIMKRMAVLQNRIIMLMSSTAIERYEHFIVTYPDIVQRVPQRMIASYLGITPEALSKAKGDRLKNR